MIRSQRVIVLECGSSRVICTRYGREERGHVRLEERSEHPLRVPATHDDAWLAQTGESFRTLRPWKSTRLPVLVLLPPRVTLLKVLPADASAEESAVTLSPLPLEEVFWETRPDPAAAAARPAFLMFIKRRTVDALTESLAKAGIFPTAFLPTAWALAELAAREKPGGEPGLLLEVGARGTTCISVGSGRLQLRLLSLGGNDLTRAIAARLKVEFSAAEAAKRAVFAENSPVPSDSPLAVAVRSGSEEFCQRWSAEVARVAAHASGGETSLVLPVTLSGGAAAVPGLAAALERALPRAAGQIVGPVSLSVSDHVAAGFLNSRAGEGVFLPERLRRTHAWRRRFPRWVAAAAVLPLAAAAPLWQTATHVDEVRRSTAEIETRLAALAPYEERLRASRETIDRARQEIAAYETLHRRRKEWPDFFSRLETLVASSSIPLWLERLKPSPAGSETEARRLQLTGCLEKGEATAAQVNASLRGAIEGLSRLEGVTAVEGLHLDQPDNGRVRFRCEVVMTASERPQP